MPERIFSNFATSTLASSIGQSDGSLTVATDTGALFPTPSGSGATAQAFTVLLINGANVEVCTCRARSGDTLTISRGSPAYAFPTGAIVKHVCAAADLNNMLQKGIFRTVDSDPDGSLTADYFGEEVLNTTTKEWWKNSSYTDSTEWRVTGHRGTVKVTISPQGAKDAGAQWQVDGGAWIDSENFSDSVRTGTVTLSFKAAAGYTTPDDQTVSIVAYRTTEVAVTYEVAP